MRKRRQHVLPCQSVKTADPSEESFDIASSYIDASSGFGIAGCNESGELVHTQAVRLLDIGKSNLREHFCSHQLKYVTPNLVENPENAIYEAAGGTDIVTGRTCYHGEFWIAQLALKRQLGILTLLARFAFEMANITWSPGYIFGLTDARNVLRGLQARLCYFHCAPGIWRTPEGRMFPQEWISWMSATDIASLLNTSLDVHTTGLPIVSAPEKIDREPQEQPRFSFGAKIAMGA